ncbi:PAS domain-containing protein [Streptomyces sp. T028]|uniref:SpoIIE family protein phosphatase n=1 Tax=Streptomyces sp. T028 TaxID=3394379 RepID=UPI003A8989BC
MAGLTGSPDVGPRSPASASPPTPHSATAVLDDDMRFVGWSQEAEELFGHRPLEVLGRSVGEILADAETGVGLSPTGDARAQEIGTRSVRRRDGRVVSAALTLSPLSHGVTGPAWLVVASDAELLRRQSVDRAVPAGLRCDSPVQLVVYDTDARVRWINTAIEKQFGVTLAEVVGRFVRDILPQGFVLSEDGRQSTDVERIIEHVLRTGEPMVDVRYHSPTRLDPHREHVWTCSYFRLQDESGRTIGVCEAGLDITDRYVARRRLALLGRVSGSIGKTLDIRRTAGDLVELVVPEFADAATVDLLEPVLRGEDPPRRDPGAGTPPGLCRVAERQALGVAAGGTEAGTSEATRLRCLTDAGPLTDPATGALVVPLEVRGALLGVVTFVRSESRVFFDDEEIELAEELVSRTAVCVDNARRYTREHMTALLLQRDLLPRALPRPAGVEIAHRYRPAAGTVGVGGDWYDVIPLSGARVGLVVGDVVGHGLGAAATMGRLRTTVAALAALDLAPDEGDAASGRGRVGAWDCWESGTSR